MADERDARLRRVYGITAAIYDAILQHQGGGCAICGRPGKTRRLAVDHDHVTGDIRGLLCFACNRFVVGRYRRADLLRAAADYLEKPPAREVLAKMRGHVI